MPCDLKSRRSNSGTRGFVLVNALVLVAALAAVSVLLLARSEAGRARLMSGATAEQVTLNLDGFDALAISILSRDMNATDHRGEAWAKAVPPVDLEQGQVSGQIQDLQGRFNVNWLADPENILAHEAFDRLLKTLAISPQTGTAIRSFLQPGGPSERAVWRGLDPALDPVGGAILSVEQLTVIPSLTTRSYDRLRPFITAIPGDALLNVNTASREVLAAFLPQLPPAALSRILAARNIQPLPSADAFMIAVGLGETLEEGEEGGETEPDPTALSADRISVASDWFHVSASTRVGDLTASRDTVLHRKGRPPVIQAHWRQTLRP